MQVLGGEVLELSICLRVPEAETGGSWGHFEF